MEDGEVEGLPEGEVGLSSRSFRRRWLHLDRSSTPQTLRSAIETATASAQSSSGSVVFTEFIALVGAERLQERAEHPTYHCPGQCRLAAASERRP